MVLSVLIIEIIGLQFYLIIYTNLMTYVYVHLVGFRRIQVIILVMRMLTAIRWWHFMEKRKKPHQQRIPAKPNERKSDNCFDMVCISISGFTKQERREKKRREFDEKIAREPSSDEPSAASIENEQLVKQLGLEGLQIKEINPDGHWLVCTNFLLYCVLHGKPVY